MSQKVFPYPQLFQPVLAIAATVTETVTLDKWFQPWPDKTFKKVLCAAALVGLFAPPIDTRVRTDNLSWQAALPEVVWKKPSLRQGGEFAPPSDFRIRTDNIAWQSALPEVVWKKPPLRQGGEFAPPSDFRIRTDNAT